MSRRILFCADASSVHTRRWVAEMAARGHACWVVTRLAGEVPGAQEVITLQPGLSKLGWFQAIPAVRRLARRIQPDWVHGHYVTGYGLWAAACGRHPMALTAWGSDILVTPFESRVMRALVGWSLRRADLITADSQDVIDAIHRYGPHAPCQQILWGADTDKFQPAAQTPPGFDVISLRSWEANYNIDVIVDGFAAFVAQRPGLAARLHLLGGGPDEGRLRAQVAALGLTERVVFHGRVDDAGMLAALHASRVSVSIPTSDATSVSVLESMACGLPIIASDLPANRQWLRDRGGDEGGVLIGPRDAPALARTLTAWSDAPERLAALGAHNRALIERLAARRTQMDAMSALYEALAPRGVPA